MKINLEVVDCPSDIDVKELQEIADKVLIQLDYQKGELSLAFLGDDEMQDLNRDFRDIDTTTDVLSFPLGDETPEGIFYLGDIAISIDMAEHQADSLDHSLRKEVIQLFAHGILHLCGYDHETDDGEMDELELKIRDEILSSYY